MTIGERILLLLRERGMTQKEFSVKTGIPQSTISEWRSKRLNPAADKIMIICEALDVDPVYLISGTENASRYEKTKSLVIYNDSDEYQMLLKYRNLSEGNKKRLQGYAQALEDLQKNKRI